MDTLRINHSAVLGMVTKLLGEPSTRRFVIKNVSCEYDRWVVELNKVASWVGRVFYYVSTIQTCLEAP